jgi:hypothetical protein
MTTKLLISVALALVGVWVMELRCEVAALGSSSRLAQKMTCLRRLRRPSVVR